MHLSFTTALKQFFFSEEPSVQPNWHCSFVQCTLHYFWFLSAWSHERDSTGKLMTITWLQGTGEVVLIGAIFEETSQSGTKPVTMWTHLQQPNKTALYSFRRFKGSVIITTLNKIINATLVFAPIFHELNSKIYDFFYVHKRPISLKYCSQICLNLC